VYCASSDDLAPHYFEAAAGLGGFLAERGIGVVTGGGGVGLMDAVATGALHAGGEVIGVIPKKLLALEVGREDLTEMIVVEGMHARKAKMAELADAFIALPGGFGTLEELFEVTTWAQLRYHVKPVGILNIEGYFDHLIAFIEHAITEGFIRSLHRNLIQVDTAPQGLIERMTRARVPELDEWLT